jgi:FixJ family two-component response regulator
MPIRTLVAYRSPASTIAVVDDDQRVLGAMEILLESADHVVRVFSCGRALLDSGCVADIDCLISDIAMPGMDGFELARLVHAARPELPIILITGQPDVPKKILPTSAPQYRLFKKPFDGPQLLTAVSDALAA